MVMLAQQYSLVDIENKAIPSHQVSLVFRLSGFLNVICTIYWLLGVSGAMSLELFWVPVDHVESIQK
jgi:hypothetical protein